jgi:perosamine synthetase
LGARYLGEELFGVTWQSFRKLYLEEGGDGIYGAWSVPYQEPLIAEGIFKKVNPSLYSNLEFANGISPVAERIQPQIMQFKTNYRNLRLAKNKAKILEKVIKRIENKNF